MPGHRVRRADPGHAHRRRPRRGVRRAARSRADPAAPRRGRAAARRSPPSPPPSYAAGERVGGRGGHPRAGRRAQRRHPRPARRRRLGSTTGGRPSPRGGQRIGAGDRIATRRNDPDLGVANRDTWIVTAVGPNGELVVTPPDRPRGLSPRRAALSPPTRAASGCCPPTTSPAHVELAYATTAYGVQGDTVPTAHVVVGESHRRRVGVCRDDPRPPSQHRPPRRRRRRKRRGSSGSRYSPATGPTSAPPTPHASPPREAARYGPPLPPSRPGYSRRSSPTCARPGAPSRTLSSGWPITEPVRDRLQWLVELDWKPEQRMGGLHARERRAWQTVEHADRQLRAIEVIVRADADRIRQQLLDAWDGRARTPPRGGGGGAARTRPVRAATRGGGPGRRAAHRLGRCLAALPARPPRADPGARRARRPVR